MPRLGILGGSFNPIHIGHLVIAERAIETLRLDRLILVPSADTPLKDPATLAPARDRLAMARLAARGMPKVAVSDVEVRRGGTSYTIDTVRVLAPRGTCFLIIGGDSLTTLPRWRDIRELAKLVIFGVAARPGVRLARVPAWIRTIPIRSPLIDVSATDLRERLRVGRSVRFFVPDAVERYLRRRRLYR